MNTPLIRIGYWRNDSHPEVPDPRDWIDESWDEDERHLTSAYFDMGTCVIGWMGYSPCRVCGEQNGSADFSDGVYVWPEGLSHYVRDHAVRLPEQLVDHARTQIESLAARTEDRAWWLAQPL